MRKKARSLLESPTVAVVYIRVSTDEQVKGYSLDDQERQAREYARAQGWTVGSVFREEGALAQSADKPEFTRMRAFLRENRHRIGYLVVLNVSRFARNMTDHQAVRAELLQMGIRLGAYRRESTKLPKAA